MLPQLGLGEYDDDTRQLPGQPLPAISGDARARRAWERSLLAFLPHANVSPLDPHQPVLSEDAQDPGSWSSVTTSGMKSADCLKTLPSSLEDYPVCQPGMTVLVPLFGFIRLWIGRFRFHEMVVRL